MTNKIIETIKNADSGRYIIFYTADCGFSRAALKLLDDKNILHSKRDIYQIKFSLEKNILEMTGKEKINAIINIFRDNSSEIGFDVGHSTRPIIFYNGKFVGGYSDLKKIIG